MGVAASGRGDWRSGSALRSHRRGHWFEPSIAHPSQRNFGSVKRVDSSPLAPPASTARTASNLCSTTDKTDKTTSTIPGPLTRLVAHEDTTAEWPKQTRLSQINWREAVAHHQARHRDRSVRCRIWLSIIKRPAQAPGGRRVSSLQSGPRRLRTGDGTTWFESGLERTLGSEASGGSSMRQEFVNVPVGSAEVLPCRSCLAYQLDSCLP